MYAIACSTLVTFETPSQLSVQMHQLLACKPQASYGSNFNLQDPPLIDHVIIIDRVPLDVRGALCNAYMVLSCYSFPMDMHGQLSCTAGQVC